MLHTSSRATSRSCVALAVAGIVLAAAAGVGGDGEPDQFTPSGVRHEDPVPEYDPGKAKVLLAQAGWRPGADGILQKDGKRFEFGLMNFAGPSKEMAIVDTRAMQDPAGHVVLFAVPAEEYVSSICSTATRRSVIRLSANTGRR